MDTKGIDQMLSVLRATSAQAGGRVSESQNTSAGSVDFAHVMGEFSDEGFGSLGDQEVFPGDFLKFLPEVAFYHAAVAEAAIAFADVDCA